VRTAKLVGAWIAFQALMASPMLLLNAQEARPLTGSVQLSPSPQPLPAGAVVDAPVKLCRPKEEEVFRCDTRIPGSCDKMTKIKDGCDALVATTTDSEGRFAIALPELSADTSYFLRVTYPARGSLNVQLGTGANVQEWNKEQTISLGELDFDGGTPASIPISPKPPTAPLPPPPEKGTKRVLFATDRLVEVGATQTVVTNKRDLTEKVTFGTCDVFVDAQADFHAGLLSVIYERDSEKYFSVKTISTTPKTMFDSELANEIKGDPNHDALLFVHGYNVSFDEACRRAAQIAYDIKFQGPVLLYSWPSAHRLFGYVPDTAAEEWSRKHFNRFLTQVLDQKGLGRLHIIAHSMGNRIVMNALFTNVINAQEKEHLGEVVLAAPDVDRALFDQYQGFDQITSKRFTLYASNHDQALRISKWLHAGPRAGDTNPVIDMKKGMDSVDASSVDTSLLGHSYIGDSRPVLEDLANLISTNRSPLNRFGVSPQGQPPGAWWKLKP
jgi:esterase/lipase superfamily enzyme